MIDDRDVDLLQRFLPVNPYTRPGKLLVEPRYVVLHWTQWPAGTPDDVYLDWKQRPKHKRFGSAAFVVGSEYTLEVVPREEITPHVGGPPTRWAERTFGIGLRDGYSNANWYTIGVEMCVIDREGTYLSDVWRNAVQIVAGLCIEFGLQPHDRIITHNYVTGKGCPKWMVDRPSELKRFQDEVVEAL